MLATLRAIGSPERPWHDYAGDPLGFARDLWPQFRLYDREEEILLAVRDVPETAVPSAHQMGKDFASSLAALWYFVAHPVCRVVVTSVKDDHLRVFFGELLRFIETAARPLLASAGGPLFVSHRELHKVSPKGTRCPLSYLRGCVSESGEGMAGHHAPHALFIADEASGVPDVAYARTDSWAKRRLLIGNTYPCDNFFRRAVQAGDLHEDGRCLRRVLRLPASDSPNVRRALEQAARGDEPDGLVVTPGVVTWEEYRHRRATWDEAKRAAGLDAEFYEGAELRLFPTEHLTRAELRAEQLRGIKRQAVAAGCDPGEGGANTAFAAVDAHGLIELESLKTPDTSEIRRRLAAFLRRHGLKGHQCCIDAGGGGKQVAHEMWREGLKVRTVAFGAAVAAEVRRRPAGVRERQELRDERSAYVNRRAQMYGELAALIVRPESFGLPRECPELRRQLAPVPRLYDGEGRLRLPPKHRKGGANEVTLTDLIGHSPDESDALALACHAMLHAEVRRVAGAC